MPLGKEIGLGPSHIVLDGDPVGTQHPTAALLTFRPMSIVAKRSPISATAELLFIFLLCNLMNRPHIRNKYICCLSVSYITVYSLYPVNVMLAVVCCNP